jgi:hypothetical protein
MVRFTLIISVVFLLYSCKSRKDKYVEIYPKQFVVSASLHVSDDVIDPIEEQWYKFKMRLFQMVYTEGKSLDEVNIYVMKEVRKLDIRVARIMIKSLVCANSSKVVLRARMGNGRY